MQKLYDLFFVSSNRHKYLEAKKILENFDINLGFIKCELQEIQNRSIRKIAAHKAFNAFNQYNKPIIIEDNGLFINTLNGFPGPFSSYVFKTIGNEGVLQLIKKIRTAKFVSVIAYCDKKNKCTLFEANIHGNISKNILGNGWGYDPIFIPKGKHKTFAQLTNKNQISHRFQALKKFSNWYVRMQESSDR